LEFKYLGNAFDAFNKELDKANRGECFIVSASYGSSLAEEVDDFIDGILRRSMLGRKFIALYYQNSSFYANLISQSRMIRKIMQKIILNPILILIKKIA